LISFFMLPLPPRPRHQHTLPSTCERSILPTQPLRIAFGYHRGMAVQQELKSDAEHMALLATLLAERGLTRYGLFAVSGEVTVAPDGYEETSGYALSCDGRAYFFWTGWDESAQRTTFDMWQPTETQTEWASSEEYQAACVAAGLS
jgi:hypothetical protein